MIEIHGIDGVERVGLEYDIQKLGMRNRVENFSRYLKERTSVFHNKMSPRDYKQRINNLNLNLFAIGYHVIRNKGG